MILKATLDRNLTHIVISHDAVIVGLKNLGPANVMVWVNAFGTVLGDQLLKKGGCLIVEATLLSVQAQVTELVTYADLEVHHEGSSVTRSPQDQPRAAPDPGSG